MRAVFLGLMICLAGCAAKSPPPMEVEPAIAEPVAPESVPEPFSEPEVATPSEPRIVMDTIMNLAPDTVQNILGAPSLKRAEREAEVWLYSNQICVLHLYFYPDDNGDFRLSYVETAAADSGADNPTVSPNACLDSLILPDVTMDPQPSSDGRDIDQ